MSSPLLAGPPADARTPLGISLAVGSATLVPLLFADHLVRDAGWRFAVPAAAVALFAALTDDVVATAGFVLVTALLVDGFVLGRGDGVLTWDGGADARRLGLLVAAAVVGIAVRSAADLVREARAR